MTSRRIVLGWVFAALAGFGLGVAFMAQRKAAPAVAVTPPPVTPPPVTPLPAAVPAAPRAPVATTMTIGKMPEDQRDAMRRRREGDYIRDSKIPTRRQQRDDHVRRAGEYGMSLRDADYADLFATLGLDDATSAQLRNHLREIIEAKADVTRSQGELLDARTEYDNRLKQLLGEKYALYRADEAAYPSRREYDHFRDFAGIQGLVLSPTERPVVEKLIAQAGAYSQMTEGEWGGPYKGAPPVVGGEDVEPFASARLANLQTQSAVLLAEARAAGVSAETLTGLEAYYQKDIAAQQQWLERIRNPAVNRRIILQRQLEALKASPNPNPRAIERMEASLKATEAPVGGGR